MDSKSIKYILRFDDLCPTMKWDIWTEITKILDTNEIKPIIAVIPNNMDNTLSYQEKNVEFWTHIRNWQKKGWMIALHGYNHVYTNHNAGILGVSANSEFATLPYQKQYEKIKQGIEVFNNEGVRVDAFIAPSHSFDLNTLDILEKHGISVISDGHLRRPYLYHGMLWIPCQLWDHFCARNAGVYTICYHHNTWSKVDIELFRKEVEQHRAEIITPFDINKKEVRSLSWCGICKTEYISWKFRIKRFVKSMIGRK